MTTTQRHYGTVVSTAPGFGYAGRPARIALADGREVKVRYAAVRGEGVRALAAGERISCLLEETAKGVFAVCVQREL